MNIFAVLCFYLVHAVSPDLLNIVRCSSNCFDGKRKYLVMMNNSCYIPQAKSSITSYPNRTMTLKRLSEKIVLFRLLSGSRVASHLYFINANDQSQTVEDTIDNGSKNFRSILLDEWANIRPTLMNITIKDYNDEVVAFLLFQVKDSDTITSWFDKTRLIDSFPWTATYIKSKSYNYFSIVGELGPVVRNYFISIIVSCDLDYGIFAVISARDVCEYGLLWPNGTYYTYPQIIYGNVGGLTGIFKTQKSHGKSMEIIGTYNSSITIYS